MHVLVIGGSRLARSQAALAEIGAASGPILTLDAPSLPFSSFDLASPSREPRVVRVDHVHLSCPDNQSQGTRLVLTQSTYVLQKLVDRLGAEERIVMTADRAAMERHAPELFFGRGAWRLFELIELPDDTDNTTDTEETTDTRDWPALVRAYHSTSAGERLASCREAVRVDPSSAIAALALASALREAQAIGDAQASLERAERLAPRWEAVWYESGTFWLAREDMERAAAAFRRAADLMPTFSAAFGHLGAALGELDRPEEALAAFSCALEHDPNSFTVLNNICVVNRELGRFDEAIDAGRQVVAIAPDFVFGHHNLGQALFQAGRLPEARAAFERAKELEAQRTAGGA